MSGNTVYFLGAGATKEAAEGAPLDQDLVARPLERFAHEPQTQTLQQFIDDVFPGHHRPPVDQIWSFLDYLVQQGRDASPTYSLDRIQLLRGTLLRLVIKEFEESLKDSDREPYRQFVQAVKQQRAAIVTPNYDTLLDHQFADVAQVHYGARVRFSVRIDEPAGSPPVLSQGKPDEVNIGRVPHLKIHGSLNWLYCRRCDEVDLALRPGIIDSDMSQLYCVNRNCTNRYEPLFITPTMFKNYENRFIREVWAQAERALTEADQLVFVGYGLKESDYQIRCLLMKGHLNRGKPYREVVVIERVARDAAERDKVNAIRTRYEQLFGDVQFQPIGFRAYVAQLTAGGQREQAQRP